MNESSENKILIIGVDGVDPDLLEKFIAEGILPNFSRIISDGAYGKIKSSIPIITTVTWTSFITGKNPGKHGIFGFVNFKKGTYELEILNSTNRKSEGIWDILSRNGKTTGIFNLPSLYPPEKINKFMLCGMLTPNKKCRFTYPADLQEEFLNQINDYEIDLGVIKAVDDSKDMMLKNIYFLTDKRYQATKYLLGKYPVDLFISIITETDRIEHYFFNNERVLRDYFKYLDEKLGNLLKDIDKDTTIFLLSDHGMGPLAKFIYINKWLIDNGLLKVNKQSTNYIKHFLFKKFVQLITNLLSRLKFNVEKIKLMLSEKIINQCTQLYCYYGGINWKESKAYFCSGAGEGIIINTKRRFIKGIVSDEEYEPLRDKIISGLMQINDPDTKKSVIEKAYKREELFRGESVLEAPDIILKLRDGYATNESTESTGILELKPEDEKLTAEHRLEGVFAAYGKHIKSRTKIDTCDILDIAPTILRIFGIEKPADFDGRVLEEIFSEEGIDFFKKGGGKLNISAGLRQKIKDLKSMGKI